MLVLKRNINESIVIRTNNGERVTVKVLGYDNRKVRIGIEAPDDVNIMRSELLQK